ncbi:MAG: nuclear transport factor 2 family protein [Bacteroidota bacterium]
MKKVIIASLLVFTTLANAQNAEIQKTIETFFDGMHQRDTLKIKSVCTDKMILQSIAENIKGNKLSNENIGEFYKSIATIPLNVTIEERILNYSIQIDGAMAHAWTPYEFYVNGKLSHSGVNAFTLFKENTTWKIIYIIDTRRK